MTLVVIGSEVYGSTYAVLRKVTERGAIVQMCYAPPRGHHLTLHFRNEREGGVIDEIVARAEVTHVARVDGITRTIGLRFLGFTDGTEPVHPAHVQ